MMDAQQFAYWLQGFSELSGETPPTPEQWASIREHLQTVFVKVTPPVQPSRGGYQPPIDWGKIGQRPATAGDLKPLRTWCSVGASDGCGTVTLC